ncbi:MspA family porin [Nocardia tengchongensis]|uniref:MspA family porin n=1 Tax=Nocardia tengchongensis TaxID=2055889 RepID=UPI0036C3D324
MQFRKTAARLAGIGATATVALGLSATGAAHADTVVPLPGGHLTQTLSDGTVVDVTLTGESATISPSMGATPVHRNAWASGTVAVQLSGATAKGGRIDPGYIVGCQVTIDGGGVNGGPNVGASWDNQGNVTPQAGVNGGGNLTLGPGQARAFHLLDLEQPDDFGREIHRWRNEFHSLNGSVSWSDETIGLSGCAGYAQARSFVNVEVETDNVKTWVTLWGQPFSLG